ncbi:MAG: DNA polymerase III subunit alpha [Elusimicrobia bacterium CG_4_10_14_3_um_filter_49_12_50_7]|nr:MAG: DNA polymerase III subunit alpha [Elusimicrobia bacterium CG_4_10_14_3_um_filter_49_12_50_7]
MGRENLVIKRDISYIYKAMRDFVHLHVHTEYSLLDGVSQIVDSKGNPGDLILAAQANGMKALAITDHGNMFGVPEFYQTCHKSNLKPILGSEFYLAMGPDATDTKAPYARKNHHLTVLSRNDTGFRNLTKLSSYSYGKGFYYRPRIDKAILEKHSEGLVVMSGCLQGEQASYIRNDRFDDALASAKKMKELFGDNFYIELMDNGMPEQKAVMKDLIELARRLNIKTVATNDVHYSLKNDAAVQDIALAIGTRSTLDDPKRLKLSTQEFYLKSGDEMFEVFREVPEALNTTLEIAEKCNVTIDFDQLRLPAYDPPKGFDSFTYLKSLCEKGIPVRYGKKTKAVSDRMAMELDVIKNMGFSSYFLIVWDFINYARTQGIAVGPGRGSGAGSIVAYLLQITDIDPLEYDLLFERFLNPGRISMPDLDIDFEEARRLEVVDYVKEKYGEDSVGQIITYSKMLAKGAIRDVGRVMGIELTECDALTKLIPQGEDIKTAMDTSGDIKKLIAAKPKLKELLLNASRIEGRKRHFGVHAAGVVITPGEISDFVPLARAKNGLITQYDGDYLTRMGLLKVDFLGLKTLTVIQEAVEDVYRNKKIKIDLKELPRNDRKTFQMLSRARTVGIFQVESEGMRDVLRKMKPTLFTDLSAVLALYRPGPMNSGMVDEFIERKNGMRAYEYQHPLLKDILEETYGVILYQEQVMLIARALAGFSLAKADVLRKAMGKKIMSVLEAQKEDFMKGCAVNKIPDKIAADIFDTLVHFAEYGFNKSHSTAYALISYQTAYLKANFPLEFMTALLNSVIGDEKKLSPYLAECERLGIEVKPADINASDVYFSARGDNAIIFGLLAVKNTGEKACEDLVAERKKNGKFKDFNDFLSRAVAITSFNKRMAEFLVKSGACWGLSRDSEGIVNSLDMMMTSAESVNRDRLSGQASLFAEQPAVVELKGEVTETQKLKYEKEALGFYFTGHPLTRYEKYFRYFRTSTLAGLDKSGMSEHILTGIVKEIKNRKTKKGKDMFVIKLEDLTGVVELVGYKDRLPPEMPEIKEDMIIAVKGSMVETASGKRFTGEKFYSAKEAFRKIPKKLKIYMSTAGLDEKYIESVIKELKKYPGNTQVAFVLHTKKRGKWRWATGIGVTVDAKFLNSLEDKFGEDCWKIES